MIFPTGRVGTLEVIFPTSRVSTLEVIIPMRRAGPAHDKRFFEWTGIAKREMSFLTIRPGYKKRKTNNTASLSGPTKQRRNFETGRQKFNNET